MHRNYNIRLLGVIFALVLRATAGGAEQPELTAANYRFYTESISGAAGTGSATSVLLVNDWRVQFIPPKEWSVRYDPQNNLLTLLSPNLEAGIRFKLEFDADKSLSALGADQLRADILSQWNGARNFRDYRRPVGGVMCIGVDFECLFGDDAVGSFRLLQVPFARGKVAVEMISSDRRFADYDQTFNALLSTFRIKPASAKPEGVLTALSRRSS